MFILKSKEQMSKAIERAKAHHPKVKIQAFGRYLVKGAAGNFYTVTCERRGNERHVDCACTAGQYGTPCYHAAAALALHTYLARVRKAERNAAAAILTPQPVRVERVRAFVI